MNGIAVRPVQVLVVVDHVGSTLGGVHHLLSSRRRRRLSEAVFLDVLDAIQESRLVDATVLATKDPAAEEMARNAGIRVTDSLASGDGGASQNEPNGLVAIIRGDLAILEGQDLAFLFGRVGPHRRVLLVPTPGSEGLSVVVARGADAFMADFSDGTLASWTKVAERRRVPTEVFAIPAGMRPSSPGDLLQMYTGARTSRAKGLLKDWRIGHRLRELEGEDR
jgi:2-phospho-L-lactate guanylyltransferase (CobY/MobA/RfbA family)